MECLELKKAIFYPHEIIIIKKKGNIKVSVDEIDRIEYDKPNFWNYLIRASALGHLRIHLKKNIFKGYFIRIKFKDVLKLPEFYLRKIDPTNKWGAY